MPINIPPNLSTSQYEQLVLQALSQIAGPGANLTSIPSILSTSDFRHLVLYALNYIANNPAGGGSNPFSYVQYITGATNTPEPGKTYWDSTFGTILVNLTGATNSVQLRVGEAQYAYVRNVEATALTKGQVVYTFGSTGNKMSVKLASSQSEATSSKTLGIVAENIPLNGQGYVQISGQIEGLAFPAPFEEGDSLYLGSTPGTFTRVKPQAPLHLVGLGVVERANAGNGMAYIKVQNGYELNEIHDVLIEDPEEGDLLVRDGGLWRNTPPSPDLVLAAPQSPLSAVIISKSTLAAVIRPWYGKYIPTGFDGGGNAIYQKGTYIIEYDASAIYAPIPAWVLRDASSVEVVGYSTSLFADPWTMILVGAPLMKSTADFGTYVYDNDPRLGGPSTMLLATATTTLAAGGQTYYFGLPYDLTMNLNATNRIFQFPVQATIVAAYLGAFTGATAPVDQATGASIDLHNFTDDTNTNIFPNVFYNTLTNRMANYTEDYLNAGDGIDVFPEKEYAIRVVSPTYTTGPSIRHYLMLYFNRRN